jgi:hypothetical protein
MIELSDADLREFQVLFKKETGKDISPKEAREYAINLLHFVALIVQPESIPSDS